MSHQHANLARRSIAAKVERRRARLFSPSLPLEEVVSELTARRTPRPAMGSGATLLVVEGAQLPSLESMESHYMELVVASVGSISGAARALGIQRSTLQRRLKKQQPFLR